MNFQKLYYNIKEKCKCFVMNKKEGEVIKMSVLKDLKPEKVFHYFEEICNIPHGSTNLDGISSYLEQFAKDHGLFHIRDKSNNIIMVKEATKGYENVEPVILQGHMDMVAVKKADCDIDLTKDPLRLKVDGDFIYAEGTSLGGDEGIAVAYILAIMDSEDIAHPREEAVITTEEEIDMEGATAIDLSMLTAKRMMNIDSEEEGILLTSCAGGARVDCNIPIVREDRKGLFYQIKIEGLQGGHSGTEINKERGNAIKLIARTLHMISKEVSIQIAEFSGGEKDNAIPREAEAVVLVQAEQEKQFISFVHEIEGIIRNENSSKEHNFSLIVQSIEKTEYKVLNQESTKRVLDFLMVLPNGVMAMSADIEGLVETSLNVGILKLEEDKMIASSAIRSSIESAKKHLIDQVVTVAGLVGGEVSIYGEYPGWQFNPDSKLRATMIEVYKEMFHEEPKVEALHAGLECGIMIAKIPGLDCVSFGPNIYDIHTTEERLSISSTERMWNYILEILKRK